MLTRGTRPGDIVWVACATLSDYRFSPKIYTICYQMVSPEHQLGSLVSNGCVVKDAPSLLPENCYANEREAMQAALELFNGLVEKCVALAAAYKVTIDQTP